MRMKMSPILTNQIEAVEALLKALWQTTPDTDHRYPMKAALYNAYEATRDAKRYSRIP